MSTNPLAVRLATTLLPRLMPAVEPKPTPGWILGAGEDPHTWLGWLRRRLLFSFKHTADFRWIDDLRITAYPYNEITRSILMTGLYDPTELHFLRRHLGPGMVFLDGGANLGIYSLVASRCVGPAGRVIGFEPSTREFDRANHHVRINRLENTEIIHAGLSDQPGQVGLKVADDKHAGHNTLGAFVYDATQLDAIEQVRLVTIDQVVEERGLQRVDLIKLDLEGAETAAIRGATRTIGRFQPKLLVEFSETSLHAQGSSCVELWRTITDLGYALGSIDNAEGSFTPLDQPHFPNASTNLIARPREAARRAA